MEAFLQNLEELDSATLRSLALINKTYELAALRELALRNTKKFYFDLKDRDELSWYKLLANLKFNDDDEIIKKEMEEFIKKGDLIGLKLLILNGVLPTEQEVNLAIESGRIDILKLFKNYNIGPTEEGANLAAANGYINVLNLLKDWGILPTEDGLSKAADKDFLDVIKWAKEQDLDLTERIANAAIIKHNFDILEFLRKYNILPNTRGANFIAGQGNIDILNLLKKDGIFPDVQGANLASVEYLFDTLAWIEKETGIFPNMSVISRGFDVDQQLKMLNLLASKGVYPDFFSIGWVDKNNKKVLNWLTDHENFLNERSKEELRRKLS